MKQDHRVLSVSIGYLFDSLARTWKGVANLKLPRDDSEQPRTVYKFKFQTFELGCLYMSTDREERIRFEPKLDKKQLRNPVEI